MVLFLILAVIALCNAQDYCMLNNPINDKCGVCTAKDVRIARIERTGGAVSCVIGQTVTVSVKVNWVSTANERYDVAAYLAKDGGNALTGACHEFILAPITTVPGNAVPGTQAIPSTGPFLDTNNDQCGDLDASTTVWQSIANLQVTCRDQDKDGVADVSGCCSWNQNRNDNNCLGLSTAVCGSPSKCRCDSVINIVGLGTCLQSQSTCSAATDMTSSCNGKFFRAKARITTTASSTSTVYPPNAVTTGYVNYRFEASPNQAYAIQIFTQAFTTASPAIIRQDLLNPCKVERQVFCGGGASSCVSVAEAQLIPRFFHENGDTPCGAGTVCTGASRNPTQCAFGYRKDGALTGSQIQFIWTLNDRITPCAALAVDGTFYEFYQNDGATAGVISLGNAGGFDFTPSGTCGNPICTIDVEVVFVIDEQSAITATGYQDVLSFVSNIIRTFTTSSPLTRFGVYFTGSSSASTPPLILTQNGPAPNLITNVIMPHTQTKGTTNFPAAIAAAINKYWPAGSTRAVARELLVIVGGGSTSMDFGTVQSLYSTRGIAAWAVGVEGGASQTVLMASMVTADTYQHYEGYFFTDPLLLPSVYGNMGQRMCPQSNLCGINCNGLCTCSSPGVNTCSCPTCAAVSCNTNSCSQPSVGCVTQPLNCDDSNQCTVDSCNPTTGVCENPNRVCAPGETCVTSVGCVPPQTCPAGSCPTNACFPQTCVGGNCVIGTALVCNDGNPCTVDTCNPATGCVYTPYQCNQNSRCRDTRCVGALGNGQPDCQASGTPIICNDNDSCTENQCVETAGCVFPNITCAATNVTCSFPSACNGQGTTPDCVITNFPCGISAGIVAGIAVGVAVGIAIAALVAVGLAIFFSKKGYDYYQARSAFNHGGAMNNPGFVANSNQGMMPNSETPYHAF